MRKNWFVLLIAILSALVISGCGSNGGSGGDSTSGGDAPTDPETGISYTNSGECINCHQGFSWSSDDVDAYLAGKHVIHSDHINAASSSTCLACHDPIGDGPSIEPYIDPADIPAEGLAAVGCETCHGPGGEHFGVGPMPNPKPAIDVCADCHNNSEGHPGPLYETVINSKHNNTHGSSPKCQRCHTTEGSIAFSVYTGDKDIMDSLVSPPAVPVDPVTTPLCYTCHDPHGLELLEVVGWDPNDNDVADQFDLCTSCHTYYNQDGDLIGSGEVISGSSPVFPGSDATPVPWSIDTAPFYHNTAWYRTIPTTHFDNPLTGPQVLDRSNNLNQSTLVEGYVIRQTINGEINENPCFDCHGHELRTNTRRSREMPDPEDADYGPTIHTQWASSAHAAHLLTEKYSAADDIGSSSVAQVDAVMQAAASDATSDGGFTHYNWDRTGRGSCQMCHTATGAANFMADQVGYDPANNDFSHLDGWAADPASGSAQNELLYCWGCHEDAGTGELREPGAITLAYLNMVPENPTLPDMGGSNVCNNCHSGRGGMYTFLDGAAADPAGAPENGGTDTHYYASGGTIFQELTNIGYMYVGAGSYDDPVFYGHDSLGCADCHMTSEESHTYQVVGKDDTDTIVAIVSKTCVSCHDGEHALFVAESQVGTTQDIWNGTAAVPTTVTQTMADDAAAEMEHEAHGYHDALDALGAVLTVAGTPPSPNYPYFSGSATDQGHGGAMHNHSYLHHEPGGYAHNRFYAKRLTFDSIDWLTNPTDGGLDAAGSRSLDGAIFLDPVAYEAAIIWLGGDPVTGVIDSRP